MKVSFRASFLQDVEEIPEKVRGKIRATITHVEAARGLTEISHIKKLHGGKNLFRIRVGEYRIGAMLEGDTLVFVRCLARKEIYRYFP